jgi:hypothetical protein
VSGYDSGNTGNNEIETREGLGRTRPWSAALRILILGRAALLSLDVGLERGLPFVAPPVAAANPSSSPRAAVETDLATFLIRNCEDFGDDVCVPGNLGRSIRAEVFVDTGVSECLGLERSTLLDYAFLP